MYQTYRQSYRNLHTFHLTGAKTVFFLYNFLSATQNCLLFGIFYTHIGRIKKLTNAIFTYLLNLQKANARHVKYNDQNNRLFVQVPIAQSIEHQTSDLKIRGSNRERFLLLIYEPSQAKNEFENSSVVWYDSDIAVSLHITLFSQISMLISCKWHMTQKLSVITLQNTTQYKSWIVKKVMKNRCKTQPGK